MNGGLQMGKNPDYDTEAYPRLSYRSVKLLKWLNLSRPDVVRFFRSSLVSFLRFPDDCIIKNLADLHIERVGDAECHLQ